MSSNRTALREAWREERAGAAAARGRGDLPGEWRHLERAHILSQPMAIPHICTHLDMTGYAVRRRDRREVAGQLLRLLLAGPGSLSGRYPLGNTGGANVSAFAPMPIPDDLRELLEGRSTVTTTLGADRTARGARRSLHRTTGGGAGPRLARTSPGRPSEVTCGQRRSS